MDDLIELTNKLQSVVSSISSRNTLDLPQIVVVGSQSSGKSSVLETIVQRDFLPRGSGIVTRRPLVLQLITLTAHGAKEYGEFQHTHDKKFYDFAEIRKEIENDTHRVAGDNKGISSEPIHLRIYSPNVLTLTLVDLPGLTKIPIGDQPTDIEKQIQTLVREYISKPNSIVLAVTPANIDLVNSDSLKFAKQVDPDGERTIGVLTKLDLMDAGTNALDILTGRAYPLKLGFIGIVNRSQQDILTHKDISEALKAENDFFTRHHAYSSIASQCGSQYLSRRLSQILLAHIKNKLPELKTKLNSLISQTQQELMQYGGPSIKGAADQGSLVLRLLTKFSTEFVAAVDGTSSEMSTKELCGGARIYFIFHNVFGNALSAILPCANLTNHDIRTAIRNSTGPRPSLFVPEIAFELLVKPQIKMLEIPSLRCVELVYEELMKICHNSSDKELQRYPKLHARLLDVVSELLRQRLGPTSSYVESLIAVERAYINTNHPDFLGAAEAMSSLKKKKSHTSHQLQQAERRKEEPPAVVPNGVAATLKEGEDHGSPPKEEFLAIFFGGSTGDRKHSMPLSSTAQHMPISSIGVTDVLRKQLDQTSIQSDEVEVQATDREEIETQLIRSLITSYFGIVRKNIQDMVPKAVMHHLVNFSRESVQNELVTALYKRELFDELLQEDEGMAAERDKCKILLDVYKKAFDIVSSAV